MSNKSLAALIVGVVVALVAWNSFYIVLETEKAVLLRFGKVIEGDVQPGLHVKIPMIDKVRTFDARLLTLDTATARFLTLEKKAVMVDAFAKWRVANADQFGKRTLHEVVSGERDALMAEITASMDRMARRELGIEVLDVRVKAIDLPREVNRSVFERMSTEREREAREHRAKGRELAEGIRADADRQRRVLLAEAYREAEETRGQGDARAAAIYAQAYSQDPEFYSFYRSLQAIRDSFNDKSDVLVLDPNSDFFRYMQKSKP